MFIVCTFDNSFSKTQIQNLKKKKKNVEIKQREEVRVLRSKNGILLFYTFRPKEI